MSVLSLRDRAGQWAVTNCDVNASALTVFARLELQRIAEIVQDEIMSSFLGPTGGWLDSPKAVLAALTEAIRKRAE